MPHLRIRRAFFAIFAKRAAKEMEREYHEIDGRHCARPIYRFLAFADSLMRPLYADLTAEVSDSRGCSGSAKDYGLLVTLVCFMVDPSLSLKICCLCRKC